MSTIIKQNENLEAAKTAVRNYERAVRDAFNEMSTSINSLLSDGFKGDAAEGFKNLFDRIRPIISDNLFGQEGQDGTSLTGNLIKIFDAVQTQLLDGVDAGLKSAADDIQ